VAEVLDRHQDFSEKSLLRFLAESYPDIEKNQRLPLLIGAFSGAQFVSRMHFFAVHYSRSDGGGVALLIRSCYSSTEVTLPDTCSGSEIIWVEIELRNHKKLLVSSFYRRPNDHTTAQLESLQLSIEFVLSRYKSPNQSLTIGDDFNLPDNDWDNNCVRCTSSRRSLHDFFLSLTPDFSLFQIVRRCH